MGEGYFVGLDMGTGSTGWAVTDENYEICRAHGKALWGVRLFESAHTAEERRGYRTARRRLARRNWRIELLQEIFAEEINQVDDGFYRRMKESRYTPEDKRDSSGHTPELPYALFVDSDYTDKDYHKQFPTIYHLRKYLMETDETPDVRLVYLAFHHMMKHRGHFLFSGNIEAIKNFDETFSQFIQALRDEELDFNLELGKDEFAMIEEVLCDREHTKSDKKRNLIKQLGATTACEKAILTLITGGTAKLSDIFNDSEMDNFERPKLSFSDSTYEDYEGVIEGDLGEQFEIVQWAKAVYDWSVLVDILGNHTSISEAKIAIYEKHKQDLAYLKKLVKENLDTEVYRTVFVKTESNLCNYSAYVGMTKKSGVKQELEGKRCDKEQFYNFLKKEVINAISDDEITAYIQNEIAKGTFLPKQTTKDNSVLPHQIHLYELEHILDNLKSRMPVLAENEDKIRKTFTFRIPYYVGPLNGIRKGDTITNWAVRKNNEKIYPWNFEDVIDTQASAERFIRRMTNKCTYLIHEDVLPKNSMLYSKFVVLNELNNLRLDGEKISVELKQKIYEDVFQHYRKVTQKRLRDYLVREGIAEREVNITGIDGDFKGTLTAYHDFKEKLTDCKLSQKDKEAIILDVTLFGEDKKLLTSRLRAMFPKLTEKNIKALCSLTYTGWGRLSEAFLCDITAPAPETGEAWNIITALWETNDNLMQLLSEKYLFSAAVADANADDTPQEISYKAIEELAMSPAVKRQIWQTLKVVKEICKIQGEPPKRIFVEMAREKAESKRTDSRRKKLMDLYKNCKEEERDWIAELGGIEEQTFRRDKLYLYYTQKGRCMYSGDLIPLEDLWDNQKWDIDHIYPQSKVMDDSLDNRVLVRGDLNKIKSDTYPIKKEWREKMQPFWKSLLDGGFITKEKYTRLVRATGFEPTELSGFIARQLVETRQSTKAVASILQQAFPDTEIVYVKAKIASNFRQEFDLIKVREMNDLHHAKDAYLNIVVGNTYHVKFTKSPARFIEENPGRSYNLERMFTSKDVTRGKETAWIAGNKGTIQTVKRVMNKNNILVTRRSYEVSGGLFDQQLMKKGKGQVPIKGSDERLQQIDKYGAYNKATGAYFALVESEDKKGNKRRTMEYVPLYLKSQFETEGGAINYLKTRSEDPLKNPCILVPKIKIDTLFKVDGFTMWLSGRTGNQLLFKGAVQLILSQKDAEILKKVIKFVSRKKENKNLTLVPEDQLREADLMALYDTFLDKIKNTVYNIRFKAQEKTLTDKREAFQALSVEERCVVLSEILHLFQCQSGAANLKSIGGPASAGIIVLNHDITDCKQISIINQSSTGVYEQEMDLHKI